ncbi:unknown [Collinsella sp. CAG:398]|nr:unknown [Collinsella sp. CAG:398]
MRDASHEARLVADADLAHVDARMEARGEVLHELAEVHAVLGGEVEDGFLSPEEILHPHRFHVEVVLLHKITETVHSLLAAASELIGSVEVGIGGYAQHRLERRAERRFLHLEGIGGNEANLLAALGRADDVVCLDDVETLRIEPQVSRGKREFYGNYDGHERAFLISKSMTSRAS